MTGQIPAYGPEELLPILQISSRFLTGNTHALYYSPAFTVTFGNIATYSLISEPAAGFGVGKKTFHSKVNPLILLVISW